MKQCVNYFQIEDAFGGNQDWFSNVVMHIGGCAAATACDSCIYFAREFGMTGLYPYDCRGLTKEEYVKFSMKMKPYIRPRVGGVSRLSLYMDGFSKYMEDVKESGLLMEGFSGERSYEEAKELITEQIDAGLPVPYLMLKHTNPKYKDFVWHWFLVVGYEGDNDGFQIITATYGEAAALPLKELWNTGYKEKGGLIRYITGGKERDQ